MAPSELSGSGGGTDKVKANAISKAKGAKATIYVGGKKVGSGRANSSGDFTFKVKDKNGNKTTSYKVVVVGSAPPSATRRSRSSK